MLIMSREHFKYTVDSLTTIVHIFNNLPNTTEEVSNHILCSRSAIKLAVLDRVVAVFVQGPAWQFKAWPLSNPVEIFTKMKGFYLQLKDMPPDPNIKKWDVKVLMLDRNRRHLDRAQLQNFWEVLDRFVIKHKPNLRA
ncbi:CDC73 [Bugula neritina]|uniref:CDC73 n=1 Tax=Bugula neritina TaxID=10212 RepID=A0A7J7JTZ0_BUGNE|nr:CDC73 [Bugula neritina]